MRKLLFVGGPKHGLVAQVPFPLTTYYSIPDRGGRFIYERHVVKFYGKDYLVALPAGTAQDMMQIGLTIEAHLNSDGELV